jgi:hypothetical protein
MRHSPGDRALHLRVVPFRMFSAQRLANHILGESPKTKSDLQSIGGGFRSQDCRHVIVKNVISEHFSPSKVRRMEFTLLRAP